MRIDQNCYATKALLALLIFCVGPKMAHGSSWESVKGIYGGTVTSLLADRQGNLFAGTPKGVFRSTNGGDTWTLGASFTPYPGAFIIDSSGAILAGATGIWRSTDAGLSWNLWSNLAQSFKSLAVAPDSAIYVGLDGPVMRGVFRLAPVFDWISQGGDSSFALESVSFIDGSTGTAVGENGTILRTTDGGLTWTRQTSGTIENLSHVCFLTPTLGIAVGGMGTILRTIDGGTHWTLQASPTNVGLLGLSFADMRHGTAVGESGTILRTTDGGITWTSQTSGTSRWLWAVSFSDSNTGTAVGQGAYLHGIILRTTNGGETWSDQSWPSTPPVYGVCFVNADTGTAVGNGILRTTNGGASWTTQESGVAAQFKAVSFTDANTGVAVGLWGAVVRTTDGGVHWVQQSNATNEILNGVSLVDEYTCVAVGSHGIIVRSQKPATTMVSHGLVGKTINSLLLSKKHGLLAIADWSSVYSGSTIDTSWVQIGSFPPPYGNPHAFAEDAAGTCFAGLELAGIYRSTNGGVSWDSTGLKGGTGYSLAPLANGKLYAGVVPLDPSIDGGIYVSSNGGATWESLGFKDWPIYSVLALDNSQILLGGGRGVLKSTNGGGTWGLTSTGIAAGNTLALLAVDSATVLVGTNFGLFRSSDNGMSWQEISEGILPHLITSLAADSSGNLFAGNVVFGPQGGIFKSTNAGRTWRCTSGDSITTYYTAIQTIIVTRMNTILAGVGSSKWWIARSTDRGETWKPVPRITNAYSPKALTFDRVGNIYGATWGKGVLHSTDDGLSWSYTSDGLSNLNVYCVAARDSGEVYAGGIGGAFRSTNAGNLWTKISTSLGTIYVTAIAFDIGGDLVISTSTGDVYRTTNGGGAWTKDAFAGSDQVIHSLSVRGGFLYAADSSGVFRCLRSTTSVKHAGALVPESARLEQNYPNPFNPTTVVSCQLPVASHIRIVVYDLLGREVTVLMDGKKEAGKYEVKWDASGRASGIYICRMTAGGFVDSKKLLLVR